MCSVTTIDLLAKVVGLLVVVGEEVVGEVVVGEVVMGDGGGGDGGGGDGGAEVVGEAMVGEAVVGEAVVGVPVRYVMKVRSYMVYVNGITCNSRLFIKSARMFVHSKRVYIDWVYIFCNDQAK